MTAEQPQQRPKKKDDVEGRIIVAQNRYWRLDSETSDAIDGPFASERFKALQVLSSRYRNGNAIVQQRVLEKIRKLGDDDSKQVSAAANQFLSALTPEKERKREADERAKREADERAKREADERAKREADERAKAGG